MLEAERSRLDGGRAAVGVGGRHHGRSRAELRHAARPGDGRGDHQLIVSIEGHDPASIDPDGPVDAARRSAVADRERSTADHGRAGEAA